MIFKELMEEARLDEAASHVVNEVREVLKEHYDSDIIAPMISILSGQGTADEKKKEIADTFKPMGGVVGVAALIASMLQYLDVHTSPKEFVQLYLTMGATQTKVKELFANSQYKPHFSTSAVEGTVKDWKGINQRFMKAGMKVNSIPGFAVRSSDGKSYTGYTGVKYFLENLDQFKPNEVNSFIGSLKKIKSTVDAKFKVKFRDLAKDDGDGLN